MAAPVRLLLLLSLAAAPVPAPAAEPTGPAGAAAEPAVEVRMEDVEIEGEIERPGVFYIIPRREVQLDLGRLTRDYTPELSRPMDPAAFERWVHMQSEGD